MSSLRIIGVFIPITNFAHTFPLATKSASSYTSLSQKCWIPINVFQKI